MSKLIKVAPVLLVALVGYTGSVALTRQKSHASTASQQLVPRNLSGSYKGMVFLFDKNNNQCLMVGPAKLEIQQSSFTLSNSEGKQLKGEIDFSIIPERENLGVGHVKLENEDPIEIRWYQDTSKRILKIVPATGAKREFRFCSVNLTQAQCFGKL